MRLAVGSALRLTNYSRPSCLVPRLRNSAFRMPSSRATRRRLLLDVVEHLAVLQPVLGDAIDRAERVEIDRQHLAVLLDRLEERRLPLRAGNVVVGAPGPDRRRRGRRAERRPHLVLAHARARSAADRCPGTGGRALLWSPRKRSAPGRQRPRRTARTRSARGPGGRRCRYGPDLCGACRIDRRILQAIL